MAGLPSRIAILPVRFESEEPSPRGLDLYRGIAVTLREKGYLVLEKGIVEEVCDDWQCPLRRVLVEKYGIDAFLTPVLSSEARNSFWLGYFNTAAAALVMERADGELLYTSRDRVSRRGGVFFETGQILQGIKESLEETKNHRFRELAFELAVRLSEGIPRQGRTGLEEPESAAQIDEIDLRESPESTHLCVIGTPYLRATASFRGTEPNLREGQPGHYCGIFVGSVATGRAEVMLRAPFGRVARTTIVFKRGPACEPIPPVLVHSERGSFDLVIGNTGCGASPITVEVFGSGKRAGPFELLAQKGVKGSQKRIRVSLRPPKPHIRYMHVLLRRKGSPLAGPLSFAVTTPPAKDSSTPPGGTEKR